MRRSKLARMFGDTSLRTNWSWPDLIMHQFRHWKYVVSRPRAILRSPHASNPWSFLEELCELIATSSCTGQLQRHCSHPTQRRTHVELSGESQNHVFRDGEGSSLREKVPRQLRRIHWNSRWHIRACWLHDLERE